jgi:beta-phosphoglucomutase-like phosphatase (HAD superfamily)
VSASVQTWRQDVTGEADAAVGRATADVLGLPDAVTVEGWIDGRAIAAQGLGGRLAPPDSYLAGARCVGVEPALASAFEDALAGVAGRRAGRFGFVVGVDRTGEADALRELGPNIVVSDLTGLLDVVGGKAAR